MRTTMVINETKDNEEKQNDDSDNNENEDKERKQSDGDDGDDYSDNDEHYGSAGGDDNAVTVHVVSWHIVFITW